MWSPEYFAGKGKSDSALNAAELLSFLKVAVHMTGDARYAAEYKKVAVDMKYAEQAARYLELRQEINYSDEELAMLSFYPFFRYTKDEAMLRRDSISGGRIAGGRKIRCGFIFIKPRGRR